MIRRLHEVGNSSALILDRALMELIGLREDGGVRLTVRGGSLIITPTDPEIVDQERFEESLDQVMRERRDVLGRLAE